MKENTLKSTGKSIMLLAILVSLALAAPLAAQEKINVQVSIPPQASLVEKIGGDFVAVSTLIDKGQDPHFFEPRPKQVRALAASRLYFTIGIPFERRLLEKIHDHHATMVSVDLRNGIKLRELEEHDHHHGGHDHGDHHDAHEDSHHHEADDHHGMHAEADPHIWLSLPNMKIMAETIAHALAKEDPQNSGFYMANKDKVVSDLSKLHSELQKELAPFAERTFYVFHPSFGYFADDYHLKQKAVEIAGKSPSPRQLQQLISQAKKDGVKVIFVQPQFDTKSAESVSKGIGGNVVPLDPLARDAAANIRVIAQRIKESMTK
jgi:zinc transport system substrate-binding protein